MEEPKLKPCPWCGDAGITQIHENKQWLGGITPSSLISVSIEHWCKETDGQPGRIIERIGRDRESAIKAWNERYND